MIPLFWRLMRVHVRSLLWYLVFAVGLIWVYVSIFPSFAESAAQFEQLIKSYPEGFLKAFGVEDSMIFTSVDNFIATEHYSLMWPILVIVLGISYAGAALAGEIESGAMDVLLAQPLTRTKIYWTKWLVGIKLISLFSLASIWSIVPLAAIYDVEIDPANYLKLTVAALAFAYSIFSLAFALSAAVSSRGRVAGIAGGVVVMMYAVDLIAKLKDSLSDLGYASLFHYYEFQITLVKGVLNWEPIAVLLGVSAIASLAGYAIFSRRDITA